MTPMILLDALRHSFLRLDMIKVLIFDECHNARGRYPYACIMMVSFTTYFAVILPHQNTSVFYLFYEF